MTTEQLQRAIHAVPFRPFVIHTADRREILVPHPDFIAHAPGTRTALVSQPDDSYEVIDLLLVVSLESPPPAAASAPGGERQS
jgi:hypothetical protein